MHCRNYLGNWGRNFWNELHWIISATAQALQLSDLSCLSWSILVDTGCPSWFHTTTALFRWIGEWSCFVFGQAIAVLLKSTTTLVNLDLSFNDLGSKKAEAWDAGRTDLILLSVWPNTASSDRPLKTPVWLAPPCCAWSRELPMNLTMRKKKNRTSTFQFSLTQV